MNKKIVLLLMLAISFSSNVFCMKRKRGPKKLCQIRRVTLENELSKLKKQVRKDKKKFKRLSTELEKISHELGEIIRNVRKIQKGNTKLITQDKNTTSLKEHLAENDHKVTQLGFRQTCYQQEVREVMQTLADAEKRVYEITKKLSNGKRKTVGALRKANAQKKGSLERKARIRKHIKRVEDQGNSQDDILKEMRAMLSNPLDPRCNHYSCKKKGEAFSVCGRCKKAYYCSKECQKRDWKRHQVECVRKQTS